MLVDGGAFWVSSLFVDEGFLLPWGAGSKSLGFVASWTDLVLGQDHATRGWQLLPFIEISFLICKMGLKVAYFTCVSCAGKCFTTNSLVKP